VHDKPAAEGRGGDPGFDRRQRYPDRGTAWRGATALIIRLRACLPAGAAPGRQLGLVR
jgi:hypothetical protein